MAHPTSRVLTVLELLQAHGRMSGSELARRLGVDVRTVRRYIGRLEEIGIPVTAERGRHGAYMLVTGFKLPPMMFTDEESLAISLGLHAVRSLGPGAAAPAVESAQAKLERVIPARLKRRVRAIGETTTLDLSTRVAPASNETLMVLSAAAQARQRIQFRYCSATGNASERDFDPYGLVYRNGNWYAGGYCHLRRGLRSFRLDRMRGAHQLDISFERPPDFNALQHLTSGIASIPRSLAVEILLHTDLQVAMESLSTDLGLFGPQADGVLFHARTDSVEWFARQLARLPFTFDVREPAELRQALSEHARTLFQRHAGKGEIGGDGWT